MKILAIDTSCDETAGAVVQGRRVLSNVIYSQVLLHKKWGGVVPSLAKRAHQERIDLVVAETLQKAKMSMDDVDAVAVTQGPGLAIALEVGITKAKELSVRHKKKLIAVNHMAGHLYSPFVQNTHGNPDIPFEFPYLGMLVSGAHTELLLWKNHLDYTVLGETVDDAAGEALDKAARLLLGVGYPGGGAIERISAEVQFEDRHRFPRTMLKSHDLNFSFSGLKTALLYKYRQMTETERATELKYLTSSFQEAVFDSLLRKLDKAIIQTGVSRVTVGGGVVANQHLRSLLRVLVTKHGGSVLFPPFQYLTGDNAAMIGVVAGYMAERGQFIEDVQMLDRQPRMRLSS